MNGEKNQMPQIDPYKDDLVLWIVMAFCLLIPVVLGVLAALTKVPYPPMLISMLLGISTAALTYRYLGGASDATFSMGLLKVTGSAALLLGTAWLSNNYLEKQMLPDTLKLPDVIAERDKARLDAQEKENKIAALNIELGKLHIEQGDSLVSRVSQLTPESDEAKGILGLQHQRKGPFASVKRAVNVRVTPAGGPQGAFFNACMDMNFDSGDTVRFSRLIGEAPDTKVLTSNAKRGGFISSLQCDKGRSFDVQLSCEVGIKLFPDKIQLCDNSIGTGWKEGMNKERVFLVTAEVLSDESP